MTDIKGLIIMAGIKRNPIRSFARKLVLKTIGDKEIINKNEIVEITGLSPLTINSILREFRNQKLINCHIGGLYSLSGEGQEWYFQLLNNKKFKKKEYKHRIEKEQQEELEKVKRTIFIDEDEKEQKIERE
ncbi:MAG: hypothetical protein GF308_01530 [Candidatus Heimdallarchaeota archaeon]|nr:hypothetical protein [Candidatus Heimdallarchaeota archaeon]